MIFLDHTSNFKTFKILLIKKKLLFMIVDTIVLRMVVLLGMTVMILMFKQNSGQYNKAFLLNLIKCGFILEKTLF